MKTLAILGAGTAGTIICNQLCKKLDLDQWKVVIIDPEERHYYQPAFLFIPFGINSPEQAYKERTSFISSKAEYLKKTVDRIDADKNKILFSEQDTLDYDVLVIASGCRIAPEETEGLLGPEWRKSIFDFYTFEGAVALRKALEQWTGGNLVVHITELPIKCPVAPLEFAFLADWWLTQKGVREKTKISFVTPLSGAFTKPKASTLFGQTLKDKNINVVSDFAVARIDNEKKKIVSWDDKTVDFDLLVSVPTNMGAKVIEKSGLGDELYFVPTDKNTLQAKKYKNIFVLGDATDLPASKAGSVAHFQGEVLLKNILSWIQGKNLDEKFDGHSNCFVETGFNKAFLIDFNYDHEPVPGNFPFAGLGPLSLMRESYINHMSKLVFRTIYWNVLLPAIPIPGLGHQMSLKGKQFN